MIRLACLLLTLAGAVRVAGADTNAIARAVRDLGASDHKTREAATRFLAEAGPEAIALLERAARDPDPEIRLRAAELLPALRLNLPADLPAALRADALKFETLDLDEQRRVVQRLSEHGRPARAALLELARRRRDPEARAWLFGDLTEQLLAALVRRLETTPLSREEAARLREALELYLALAPEDPLVSTLAVQRLDAAGLRAEADQIFDLAYGVFEKQCAADPGNPEPHNNLAWLCAVARRRLDDGLKHIELALRVLPRSAPLLDTKAELLFQTGKTNEALALIEKAIELDPQMEYLKKQRDRIRKGDPAVPPPEPDLHER